MTIGRASGLPAMQIPHFLVRHALCRVHLRRDRAKLRRSTTRRSRSRPASDKRNFDFHARLLRAHWPAAPAATQKAALDTLRELLAECRESGYYGFLRLPADVLTPVLALALGQRSKSDYVRKLIRRRKLSPPGPDVADWPWPLALRTFGEFAIARDGEPLVSKGKAQKKPLELLKALVTHGGRGVDATHAHRASSGPMPKATTPRRRSTATCIACASCSSVDGALHLADGKLSLNPELVWLDVWAFETALDAGDIDAALALYRGHFLALDAPLPWTLPARDRLQAKLVRAVLAAGDALEATR